MVAVVGINEPQRQAHPSIGSPYRTFEQMSHSKFARDGGQISILVGQIGMGALGSITFMSASRARLAVISSCIATVKNVASLPGLRFSNGSTAMERSG